VLPGRSGPSLPLDAAQLRQVLFLGAGAVRTAERDGRRMLFRASGSAGPLDRVENPVVLEARGPIFQRSEKPPGSSRWRCHALIAQRLLEIQRHLHPPLVSGELISAYLDLNRRVAAVREAEGPRLPMIDDVFERARLLWPHRREVKPPSAPATNLDIGWIVGCVCYDHALYKCDIVASDKNQQHRERDCTERSQLT
jgi:hypothetical protein